MKFLRKGKKMLRAIVVLLLAGQAAVVALAANPTGSYSAGGVGDYTLTIKKEVPDPGQTARSELPSASSLVQMHVYDRGSRLG